MITPSDPYFQIHQDARFIHGWTKDKLMALDINQRPTLEIAW